jgi:RNA polymerase sigma-70 factor (sigma-E family)
MDRRAADEVTEFVRARYGALVRVAYLLCGDAGRAEDLVQTALAKTALAWHRIDRGDGVDQYVQRVLVNTYISARRRRSWWERPLGLVVDVPSSGPYDMVDERDALRRALGRLPARQRAAVVLRHYQDLSERQVAAAMGCSVGTVKSLTSRALRSLRRHLAEQDDMEDVDSERGAVHVHG